jgi:hypothetical protein
VYRWHWFGLHSNNEAYYFKGFLGILRGANPEFRNALAEQALERISNPSGTQEHAKAVTVLAYLGDERLVANLETRLAQNGVLGNYENHALIALGTDSAGALFARSVMAVGAKLVGLPDDAANHQARWRIINLVNFTTDDICYLLNPTFQPHLERLIEDSSSDISWIASDLAKCGMVASLFYPAAVAADRRNRIESERRDQRSCITPDLWLGWWRQSPDLRLRRRMLRLRPLYPSPEVETILIECLDSTELRGSASLALGDHGVVRSAVHLRGILAEEIVAGDLRGKYGAARALGDLRDEAAVPLLEKTAAEYPEEHVVDEAVSSLGLIGNPEAERALVRLLQSGKGGDFEETVLEALLLVGSASAVSIVVDRARSRQDGPHWLCKRLSGLDVRGWHRGEFYTHIHTDELVDYLASSYNAASPEHVSGLGEAFRQIDSPAVRGLLQKWAGLRGSAQDPFVGENGRRRLSDICFEGLRDRGDESAIEYTLDEREDKDDHIYLWITADFLRPFPAAAIAVRLRLRLAAATTASETLRLLALLGRFGQAVDAELASRFQDHPDDLVANVACETMLRLSDPMLVPEYWRTM